VRSSFFLLLLFLPFGGSCTVSQQPQPGSLQQKGSQKESQKESQMAPTVQLIVEVTGQHAVARLTIADPSPGQPFYVEKSKFPSAPPLRSKLFRIECEGKEIRYIGVMAKRPAPTREDFLRIAPGGEIHGAADITELYAFLPGTHDYTIVYRAFHADPDDDTKLTEVRSNQAPFQLTR